MQKKIGEVAGVKKEAENYRGEQVFIGIRNGVKTEGYGG